MKKFTKLLAPFVTLSILLVGCSNGNSNEETKKENAENKITVQATIFPIVDFTEKIGGKYVDVTSIYPTGADSHTYEPTQQQMVDIAKSDLFIYSGGGMEGFADKVESVLKDEDTKIVVASEGITLIGSDDHHDDEEEDHDHDHSDTDPHIWLDPNRAIIMAENIKNALVAQMPDQKEYFESNFATLKADLQQLDADFKKTIENSKLDTILVSHAAYGYWTDRYGLKQIAVAGVSSSDEPSQKELSTIVKKAKEYNIDTILFETISTPKVAKVIKEEANLDMLQLNHVSTISDEDKDANKDYFDLMNENLDVLKKVLNP